MSTDRPGWARHGPSGNDAQMGLLIVALVLPVLLLALMLAMERVERPLRAGSAGELLSAFLDTARPEEVDTFVREGSDVALDRYRKRRRLSRLLPGRPR